MKCAILAAGKGLRMRPLTEHTPKPLILVNNKPFLEYLLNNIYKAGFDDIAIIIGYKGEQIVEWCRKNKFKINFIEQKEQKGTADAINLLKDWAGNNQFVVLMGDNLYSPIDLKSLKEKDEYSKILSIKGDSRPFGELITDKDFLVRIREKAPDIITGLINAGAYKFTPEIFEEIKKLKPSPRGEYEITDALTALAKERKVKVIQIKDYWINFSSIEDIKTTEDFLKKSK